MKKTIAIFLISIFLLNSIGIFFIYKIYALKIRHEVQAQMTNARLNQISVITIKKADEKQLEWSWFETDHEFEYHGLMYDIIKKVVTSAQTSYYCIPDYKESQISNILDEIVHDYMAHSKQVHNIKKLIEKLVCYCNTASLPESSKPVICNKLTEANIKSIPWTFLDIIVQPPKSS